MTVQELRDQLEGWSGEMTFRIEDQEGRLIGNVVTDVYRYRVRPNADAPHELVIAVDVKDADEPV